MQFNPDISPHHHASIQASFSELLVTVLKMQSVSRGELMPYRVAANRVRLTQPVSARTEQDLIDQGYLPENDRSAGRWTQIPYIAPIARTSRTAVSSYAVIDNLTSPDRLNTTPGILLHRIA